MNKLIYNKPKQYLTYKQICWLDSRGGRTAEDVLKDKYGLYVVMNDRDGFPTLKVYLPK